MKKKKFFFETRVIWNSKFKQEQMETRKEKPQSPGPRN